MFQFKILADDNQAFIKYIEWPCHTKKAKLPRKNGGAVRVGINQMMRRGQHMCALLQKIILRREMHTNRELALQIGIEGEPAELVFCRVVWANTKVRTGLVELIHE